MAAPAPRRRARWYQSPIGLLLAGLGGVGLIAIVVAFIVTARSGGPEPASSDALSSYTSELAGLQQALAPAAAGMASTTNKPGDVKALDREAQGWSQTISQIAGSFAGAPTPAGLDPVKSMVTNAIGQYGVAADAYALAPSLKGTARAQEMALAAKQREQADSLWRSAVAQLDAQRSNAGLGPSHLTTPSSLKSALPSPTPTPGAGGSPGGKKKSSKG